MATAASRKLYGFALSSHSVRIAALLNEKGLDYELVPVDLGNGDHKKPEFLAINPFGQIPAFQDGDEILFESRAINRHIATKYKTEGPDLLPTPSAKLEVWLEVEAHHFCPAVSDLVSELRLKPRQGDAPDPAAVAKHAHALSGVLDVYDAHLADNRYLAGDQFTLADVNHMGQMLVISLTPKMAELVASRPHVKAWWEDISARPAWKKTVAALPLPPAGTA